MNSAGSSSVKGVARIMRSIMRTVLLSRYKLLIHSASDASLTSSTFSVVSREHVWKLYNSLKASKTSGANVENASDS